MCVVTGAAPRALFPPPPKPSPPAEPDSLQLSRVLGYSGERPEPHTVMLASPMHTVPSALSEACSVCAGDHLPYMAGERPGMLVGLPDGRRVLYAVASTLVVQVMRMHASHLYLRMPLLSSPPPW